MIPHTVLPYSCGYVFTLPFGDSSIAVVILNNKPPNWGKETLGFWQGNPFYDGELNTSLGIVELWSKQIGSGYVTHEFAHALMAYMEQKGWKPNDDNYEDACYAISEAVSLFWNKYYALYPEEEK